MDTSERLIATRIVVGRHTRGYRFSVYRRRFGVALVVGRRLTRVQVGVLRFEARRR